MGVKNKYYYYWRRNVKISMTKKTNSLVFRFGLSALWKNKCIGNKSIRNFIQLENIIHKELKKKKLNILKITCKSYLVNIFVYNDYKLNNKLKNQVRLYYKKVLCVQKTTEKFGLSEEKIFWFLNKTFIKPLLNLKLKNFLLIIFFYKYFFLC